MKENARVIEELYKEKDLKNKINQTKIKELEEETKKLKRHEYELKRKYKHNIRRKYKK